MADSTRLCVLYQQINESGPIDIFGLWANPSQADIKTAYRSLALLLHPDKCAPELQERHSELFKKLQEAYSTLLLQTPDDEEAVETEPEEPNRETLPETWASLHQRNCDFRDRLRRERDAALEAKREYDAIHKTKRKRYGISPFPKSKERGQEGKGGSRVNADQTEQDIQHRWHSSLLSGKGKNVSLSDKAEREDDAYGPQGVLDAQLAAIAEADEVSLVETEEPAGEDKIADIIAALEPEDEGVGEWTEHELDSDRRFAVEDMEYIWTVEKRKARGKDSSNFLHFDPQYARKMTTVNGRGAEYQEPSADEEEELGAQGYGEG